MSNTKQQATDPTQGFDVRLSYFLKEVLKVKNDKGAMYSGLSYSGFMAWMGKQSAPVRPEAVYSFVMKALEDTGQIGIDAMVVAIWLCFGGTGSYNPFDRRSAISRPGGQEVITEVFLLIEYVERLASEAGLKKDELTKKRLELAVRMLAKSQSVALSDGILTVSDSDRELVKSVLTI